MMKLVLVGCGKLGSICLERWLESGFAKSDVIIIAPNSNELILQHKLKHIGSPQELEDGNYIVVFAVKPQIIDEIIGDYARFAQNSIFISLLAGKYLAYFQEQLGNKAKIVRVMMNIAAKIGRSTSSVSACNLTTKDQDRITDLLDPLGKNYWYDSDNKFDDLTAITGSSPAYFYAFAESLVDAGKAMGLDPALTEELVNYTLISSAMLLLEPDSKLQTLRESVTSKGGATAAALNKFSENNALKTLVLEAAKAAKARSIELS